MNLKEIKEMLTLMNENGLSELEIEKEGMRIRLKKMGANIEMTNAPISFEPQRITSAQTKESVVSSDNISTKTVEIKAPMVGTFYRAPTPEAPPYVEVGQNIEPGQVICIIEAMKLMNEIKAETRGKLLEILVDNAEPVEFGQPMFLIELL